MRNNQKMNKFIALFLLFISVGYTIDNYPSNISNEIAINDESKITNEPYDIKLQIDKTGNNEYRLVVTMELNSGSFFVSPYSSDRFSGRFNISIEDNGKLELDSKFIETPRSVEEYDPHPFVNGLVNWVSVNTTYKHQLHVMSQNDFEVIGLVSFTIEPRCTFEKVPFIITYKSGELKIKQLNNDEC